MRATENTGVAVYDERGRLLLLNGRVPEWERPGDGQQDRYCVAVHEASHCAAAFALGVPVGWALVELAGRLFGQMDYDGRMPAADERAQATITIAGPVGESLIAGTPFHLCWGRDRPDGDKKVFQEQVAALARGRGWTPHPAVRELQIGEQLKAEAGWIVQRFQARICTLADRLLRAGRLTGAEVEAVLRAE